MKRYLYYIIAAIPLLLIPFMGTTWLIFSIYMLILAHREWFSERMDAFLKKGGFPGLLLIFLLSGLVLEVLAVIDNLPKPPGERILLHPDPVIDLYLALGYYGGFALAWSITLWKVKLSHKEVFLIAGAFGILFEQTGALLFTFQIFAWPYVFLVYGSYQAIPPLLASKYLNSRERKEYGKLGKILVGALVEVSGFILAGLFLSLLKMPL